MINDLLAIRDKTNNDRVKLLLTIVALELLANETKNFDMFLETIIELEIKYSELIKNAQQ